MNDTTNPTTLVTDAADAANADNFADNDVADTEGGKNLPDADVVLNDLEMMAADFFEHVQTLRTMQENGFFRYASKECRNKLLDELLSKVDAIDETTKVAFRTLKKVKRERVPDSLVDMFLVAPAATKNRFGMLN